MGVRTEADVHLDTAKDNINKAVTALAEIVVNGCWGSDEYSPEYCNEIEDIFNTLLKIRKKFKV